MIDPHEMSPGEYVWLIRKGKSVNIKLLCPSCQGVGFLGSVMAPCDECAGSEYITQEIPTFEVVGAVRVRMVTWSEKDGEFYPSVEILRPPLYLLDAYSNNVIEMCKDYWDDWESGMSNAGAYAQTITDMDLLCKTYEEALEIAADRTNWHIQDACDLQKTVLYDKPEEVFKQTEVTQAQADSVEIFKEAEIEDALC